MPAGPVHYKALMKQWPMVIGVSVALLPLSFLIHRGWNWSVLEFDGWFLFWFWMARYIDPDLDQPGVTAAEGRMVRELRLVGVFLASYFAFYAHLMNYIQSWLHTEGGMFGAHQSRLTHSVVPGTVIRMGFLFLPMPYVLLGTQRVINFVVEQPFVFQIPPIHFMIYFAAQFCALGWADSIHISLDRRFGEK